MLKINHTHTKTNLITLISAFTDKATSKYNNYTLAHLPTKSFLQHVVLVSSHKFTIAPKIRSKIV